MQMDKYTRRKCDRRKYGTVSKMDKSTFKILSQSNSNWSQICLIFVDVIEEAEKTDYLLLQIFTPGMSFFQ